MGEGSSLLSAERAFRGLWVLGGLWESREERGLGVFSLGFLTNKATCCVPTLRSSGPHPKEGRLIFSFRHSHRELGTLSGKGLGTQLWDTAGGKTEEAEEQTAGGAGRKGATGAHVKAQGTLSTVLHYPYMYKCFPASLFN